MLELLIDNLKTSGYLYYGATTLTQNALGYFIYGAMRYHLRDIEAIFPNSEGTAIYRYETHFDTSSNWGKLKGKPIGIEYLGTDHKSVVLSFPLYYMNFDQAKEFLEYVLIDKFNELTEIDEEKHNSVPSAFSLKQNHPNPFNPKTNIRFEVSKNQIVSLEVYDVLGNKIATLINEEMSPGSYDVTFDASSLASGVYVYKLQAGDYISSMKMILLK